jgi:hypothetical protein
MQHLVYAPYRVGKEQLSVSLTGTQTGAPSGAGFGVTCRRGTGATQVSYSFVVLNSGRFYIERDDATSSGPRATIVERGQSPLKPGSTPITVVAICATLADGTTTRLALFIEGRELADFTNATKLSGTGWVAGIDMSSGKTPSTMTASNWEERDLSR